MTNQNDWNTNVINEFRANGGKVGGNFANMSLLLLHTIGAKSGQERTNPLAYYRDGNRYIIIASKGGAPTDPDWYRNLIKNPMVTVEVGTEKFKAKATPVTNDPERERLYEGMEERNPGFTEYKYKTTRKIPAVVLERID